MEEKVRDLLLDICALLDESLFVPPPENRDARDRVLRMILDLETKIRAA